MSIENFSSAPRAPKTKKEVNSGVPRSPKSSNAPQSPRVARGSLRNNLLTAAALTLTACSDGNEMDDQVANVSQALIDGWDEPSLPNLGLTGAVNIAQVERSGSHIDLYVINAALTGNSDVIKVGTDDGVNWNSPSPTLIQGIDSQVAELDFKIQGTKAYVVSGKDGISTKLYMADWNGTSVSNLTPVQGGINDDFATVSGVAFNESGTKIFATSDLASPNSKLFMANVGTWNWMPLDSCSTSNTDGVFVSGNNLFITSDRSPTEGGFDAMVFDGGWSDALNQCQGTAQNINNYTTGVVKPNDSNDQRNIYIDSNGDQWVGGYQLKWSKKKTGGAGGAAGSAGMAGAGGAGMAGAGGAGQAGMAGQPGGSGGVSGQPGGSAGAGAEAGAGGAGQGGVAGQPGGSGGVSGQPGGSAGAGAEAGAGGAGQGGVAGQPGGSGGVSGQPGGSAGAGAEAGTGGAGQGGEAGQPGGSGGMGGSGGSPEGGSAGSGAEAGAGGSVSVPCDILKINANSQNIKVKTCDDKGFDAVVSGPVNFTVDTKTVDVYNVVLNSPGTVSYVSYNQYLKWGAGIEKKIKETSGGKKLIDYQYGDFTGYEGTEVDDSIPGGALNPNKDKGIYNVVMTTVTEGRIRKYEPKNCDINQLEQCTPRDFVLEGTDRSGEVSAKTKPMFKELSSGKYADDPSGFEILDQVPGTTTTTPPPEDNCSVSVVGGNNSDSTGFAVMGGFALGLAALRRRKGFVGVTSK